MIEIKGIPIWGDPIDPGALQQILNCSQDSHVLRAAMMADHHKGYSVPIGGVLELDNAVSPSAVGYDIGCGNKAIKLDVKQTDIDLPAIVHEITRSISFGVGRKNKGEVDHPLFDLPVWSMKALRPLKQTARDQLGTVGGGNHYVDIFVDTEDYIWVGVHFGSRGLGHKIATYFLKEGNAQNGMDAMPLILSLSTDLGQDYWSAMELAGKYAYAGRDWVCDTVANIIGADVVKWVHNHHNYAWKHGSSSVIVRKGATPVTPIPMFIGGSMGTPSYIVWQRADADPSDLQAALWSAPHGAGRIMSRTVARGKIDRKTGQVLSAGRITPEMFQQSTEGVLVRGGDLDEAPGAYKDIDEVLNHHSNTLEIIEKLQPIAVIMAGRGIRDPYKD